MINNSKLNGYDFVAKELDKFMYETGERSLVVRIKFKYEWDKSYDYENVIVENDNGHWIFDDDWWEGQTDVEVVGIKTVYDVLENAFKEGETL